MKRKLTPWALYHCKTPPPPKKKKTPANTLNSYEWIQSIELMMRNYHTSKIVK